MERKNTLFNPTILFGVMLVFLLGVLIGVSCAENSPESQELIKNTNLFSNDFKKVLKYAIAKNAVWTCFAAVGGINVFLIPLSIASLFMKGYTFGFTSGCIVATMSFEGYFTVLSGLFIHNFLFAACSVFYATYGINKSFECFLNRRNYDCIVRKNKSFVLISLVFFTLSVLIAIVEAFISLMLYDI